MGDDPVSLVRAAIRASNPHNYQRWLFHLTANQIDVYAEIKQQIATIAPFLRKMYIGIGCTSRRIRGSNHLHARLE